LIITEPTLLCPGMTAKPTSRQVVVVDIDPAADPIALTPEILDSERARLGSKRNADGTWTESWKFRKEYGRDFFAVSGQAVFDDAALDWQRGHVANPLYRMDLDESGKLIVRERGRLLVYLEPDSQPAEMPPDVVQVRRAFGLGMDVGAGTGASDSAIEVLTQDTREQCAELADNRISPTDLGRFAAAVGRWYNDALICCPSRMHGLTTIRAMRDECKYGNIWHTKILNRPYETSTDALGWRRGESTDEYLFGRWIDAIDKRAAILHGIATVEQHRAWVYDEQQRICHRDLIDAPEELRHRHADRVIACAMAWRAACDSARWQVAVARKKTGRELYIEQCAARKASPWRRPA
jgi:hypothetical protein